MDICAHHHSGLKERRPATWRAPRSPVLVPHSAPFQPQQPAGCGTALPGHLFILHHLRMRPWEARLTPPMSDLHVNRITQVCALLGPVILLHRDCSSPVVGCGYVWQRSKNMPHWEYLESLNPVGMVPKWTILCISKFYVMYTILFIQEKSL